MESLVVHPRQGKQPFLSPAAAEPHLPASALTPLGVGTVAMGLTRILPVSLVPSMREPLDPVSGAVPNAFLERIF